MAALQPLVWVWAALCEGTLLPPIGITKFLWILFLYVIIYLFFYPLTT